MLGNNDVESSASEPLYPQMQENPEFRWSFIRKVYSILAIQFLLTVAVASLVISSHVVFIMPVTTWIGAAIWIAIGLTPFILLIPLTCCYYNKHPVNYILLGLFTLTLAFVLGIACSGTSGEIILEAFILTATLLVSLTAYTFWAAKRGHEFGFLRPFVCGATSVLSAFVTIQIWHPLGSIGRMMYGLLGALLMCVFIVWDTDNLIQRYTYDEFILASTAFYLDVIRLFIYLLGSLRSKKEEE